MNLGTGTLSLSFCVLLLLPARVRSELAQVYLPRPQNLTASEPRRSSLSLVRHICHPETVHFTNSGLTVWLLQGSMWLVGACVLVRGSGLTGVCVCVGVSMQRGAVGQAGP